MTAPSDGLVQLDARFDALRTAAQTLANALDRQAALLRDSGEPVPEDVMGLIMGHRDETHAIQREIVRIGGESGLTIQRGAASGSLLGVQLHWLKQRLGDERQREEALAILDEAAALRVRDANQESIFEPFRRAVHELREMLAGSQEGGSVPAISELTSRAHPIVAVLDLVAADDTLYDPRLEELRERILMAFGPALAWLAIRGKLHVPRTGEMAAPEATPEPSPDQEESVLPAPLVPPAPIEAGRPTELMPTGASSGVSPADASARTAVAEASSAASSTEPPATQSSIDPIATPVDPAELIASEPVVAEPLLSTYREPRDEPEPVVDSAVASAGGAAGIDRGDVDPPATFEPEVERLVSLIRGLPVGAVTPSTSSVEGDSGVPEAPVMPAAALARHRELPIEDYAHFFGPRSHARRQLGDDHMFDRDDSGGGSEPHGTWPAALDSRALAQALVNHTEGPTPSDLQILVCRLVADNRLSLAFHLADYVVATWPQYTWRVSPSLLAAVAMAGELTQPTGALSGALFELLPSLADMLLHTNGAGDRAGVELLLMAGTISPALLAPATRAADLLSSVVAQSALPLPLTRTLCDAVTSFSFQGAGLDLTLVTTTKSVFAWRRDLDALQKELTEWWDQAQWAKINYAPATSVWTHWLRPDGVLHAILDPIRRDEVTKVEDVTHRVATLAKLGQFRRAVERTDRQELRRRRGEEIHARALEALQNHAAPALSFARRWLALCRHRPETIDRGADPDRARQGNRRREAARLHDIVSTNGPLALQELAEWLDCRSRSDLEVAGISQLTRAVRGIVDLFDPMKTIDPTEPEVHHVLNVALLAADSIPIRSDWTPVETEASSTTLLVLATEGPVDWFAAYEAAESRGDHRKTRRIIEYLRAQGHIVGRFADLPDRRRRAMESANRQVSARLFDAEAQIEEAVVLGRLQEAERLDLVAQLEGLEISLADAKLEDFGDADLVFRHVRDRLVQRQAEGRVRIQQALDDLNVSRGHPLFPRIQEALARDDFLTADELLAAARDGREHVAVADARDSTNLGGAEDRHWEELFRDRKTWDRELSTAYKNSSNPRSVLRRVAGVIKAAGESTGVSLWDVELKGLRGKLGQTGGDLVQEWSDLKDSLARKPHAFDEEDARRLRRILDLIGFRVKNLQIRSRQSPVDVLLEAAPVTTRQDALVPTYGSGVKGTYQLRIYSGRPREERIMGDLSDSVTEPVIVLFFGLFSPTQRPAMSRLSRERGRSVIVLDDLILIYLATVRGSRLRALFACTLPYTFAQPYSTIAGTVAPEMFYGREAERREIARPLGSCFIYGGRQLGKTALLKRVRETEHRPADGQIVLWLDLKDASVGIHQPLDHLWYVLATALQPFGVLSTDFNARGVGSTVFLAHVERWLNFDARRRILLLLDEADVFLERDGVSDSGRPEEAFEHLTLLKGAIDRTDARFKVVFAGLHDVVRATTSANNPLSHFGQPTCVGPLFEGTDAREARWLVESPLRAAGYSFADANLVGRILYRTNYYPSLIQLYCASLVTWMNRAERLGAAGPMYQITSSDVEAVYRSQNLRDEIQRRFRITIELDQRYEVIAYAIALAIRVETGSRGLESGFDVAHIFGQAVDWWEAGFRDTDRERFALLLDEMVGLGILRASGAGRYSLRSPNVLLLLGTEDEILAALMKARLAPLAYKPATFRGPYPSGLDVRLAMRNPLTEQQLGDLRRRDSSRRVFVVCGAEAAGIGDARTMLTAAFGGHAIRAMPADADHAAFVAQVDDLADREGGMTILLVGAQVPWDTEWLATAHSRMSRSFAHRRQDRIVFVATPQRLTTMLQRAERGGPVESHAQFLALRPWHVDAIGAWVEEINEGTCGLIGPEDASRLAGLTGGWPILIAALFCLARGRNFDWVGAMDQLESALDRPDAADAFLDAWGLAADTGERRILDVLARWADPTAPDDERQSLLTSEIADLLGDVSVASVRSSLTWASYLGLASMVGRERWTIAPVPGRLLRATALARPHVADAAGRDLVP